MTMAVEDVVEGVRSVRADVASVEEAVDQISDLVNFSIVAAAVEAEAEVDSVIVAVAVG
jgi:hypothetical protein